MAHNVNLSNEYAKAQAAAGGALANGGFLRLYDGVQPGTANATITTQRMLAELRFGNPAGVASDEMFSFGSMINESSAPLNGTPTWYRAFKANGTSPIRDGSVGLVGSGSDLELDNIDFVVGAEIAVDSLVWRVTK